MSLTPVTSSNSNAANLNQVNSVIRELNSREVTQIFKDDSGTRRVLIGKGADGYGIRVSQSGTDVIDATSDQLVMSSDFNMFKITDVVDVTLSITGSYTGGTNATASVAHGLGTAPLFFAWLINYPSNTDERHLLPLTVTTDFSAADSHSFVWYTVRAYTTDTNCTVVFNGDDSALLQGSWVVRFYLTTSTLTP